MTTLSVILIAELLLTGRIVFADSSAIFLILHVSALCSYSLSEYEDNSLRILSWKGIKIASIFLSHFLFLTGSIMVRRLSFGSFALLTYPTFSNLDTRRVTTISRFYLPLVITIAIIGLIVFRKRRQSGLLLSLAPAYVCR
jgi:hypothetical protein